MADSRFNALATDPRYRLPSRKQSRTPVDPRFKRLLTDEKKSKVDKYGRRTKPAAGTRERRVDKQRITGKQAAREVVGSSEEESEEEELLDEETVEKRDPAREGGFSESSSEEESTSEENSDDEIELAEETAGQEQIEDVPMGEVTQRIACVNLDWDNIRATDIMAVASSFVPTAGKIDRVTIYPSEFGRERMEREELEGPPREIFASSANHKHASDSDSDDDNDAEEEEESSDDEKIKRQLQQGQVNEGEEFDTAKLRQYQLERLRYYYAVISCDSLSTAKALYDNMDGREYLTTSNFFDLRFIPDTTSFDDDKPRGECAKLPDGYKPNDFRTEALTHSKAKLTWDDDDTTRKEVQKRAFSRREMDENDLQAYIGSDSSDAGSVASRKSAAEDRKKTKKEAERAKMRAALGLGEANTGKKTVAKDEPVGDMQITFTSGLSGEKNGGKGVFENEPQDEESTRQRYIRKERERKQRRKEKFKSGGQAEEDGDAEARDEDKGFDDPFFHSAASEQKAREKDSKKKKVAKQSADEEQATERQRKELELLMAGDQADDLEHFDMREIEKAEKAARRKGKKRPAARVDSKDAQAAQDVADVDAQDPRFSALFENHEYAIDPTAPLFTRTKGMKAFVEEGRQQRKRRKVDE